MPGWAIVSEGTVVSHREDERIFGDVELIQLAH